MLRNSYLRMGVERTVLRAGHGPTPRAKQTVTLHMRGMLQANRTEFWNTVNTNQPFSFVVGVGQVIKGMDEGVMAMKLGEKAELNMSADYAYGAKGFPAWSIPGNANLIFECELLRVE